MWIQTSYNTKNGKYYNADGTEGDQSKAFRGNYAGIGFIWDEDNNIFIQKQQYPSWVKNITEARWVSPIGDAPEFTEEQQSQNMANSHRWQYDWNEDDKQWDLTDLLS